MSDAFVVDQPTSLQDITDVWGEWMVTQWPKSKGFEYTASTVYSESPINKEKYQSWKVVPGATTVTFSEDYPPPQIEPADTNPVTYVNETPNIQYYTYSVSEEVDQTSTMLVRRSLMIGLSVNETIGIPRILQGGGSQRANVTFSETSTNTTTHRTKQAFSNLLTILDQSTLHATTSINANRFETTWVGETPLVGYVAIMFKNSVEMDPPHKGKLWFIYLPQVFDECVQNNLIPITGYTYNYDPNDASQCWAKALTSGTFTGQTGTYVGIKISSPDSDAAPEMIPLTPLGRPFVFGGEEGDDAGDAGD